MANIYQTDSTKANRFISIFNYPMSRRAISFLIIWLLTVVLIPATIVSAQFPSEKDYTLYLKNGSFTPSTKTGFSALQEPSKNELFNHRYYRVVQFYDIPGNTIQEELKQLGVELIGYMPQYAYYVAISEDVDLELLQNYNVRSVISIDQRFKLDSELFKTGGLKNTCKTKEEVDLLIKPFNNVALSAAKKALVSNKIKILEDEENAIGGIAIRISVNKLDKVIQLPFVQYIEPLPLSPTKDDTRGRSLHRANTLDSDYASGRHYDGTGVSIALADDGIIGPHIDYTGRLIQLTTDDDGNHGDMTAGILFGAGNLNPTIKGMAPGSFLYCFKISGYPHVNKAVDHMHDYDIWITSTSYSQGSRGRYNNSAAFIDQQISGHPQLIHVFSAGNDGEEDHGYGAGDGWGNITGGYKAAKNVIAVGNLDDQDVLLNSSSRGPADDGRIKPDICANGHGQMSTDPPNSYRAGSGTSAAAPGIAGVIAQLYHAYKTMHGGANPESPLIKACLLNTADDLGNPGPDYLHGWGRVNALRAIQTLEESRYLADEINHGSIQNHTITVPPGTVQLRAMLYWLDPEGSPGAGKSLVNDLDMTVSGPSASLVLPWVLNPTPDPASLMTAATRGVDRLNNMEQVTINQPLPGNYTITVNGYQVPFGPQQYYIVYEFVGNEITVTYPIGGESFVPGETEKLRWDAFGNSGIFTIMYSVDSTYSWDTIISTIPGYVRFYNWTVPGIVSGQVIIKIARDTVSGQSVAPFNIIDVPKNFTIEWSCPDSVKFVWDTVGGASGYEISKLGSMYMDSIGRSTVNSFILKGIRPYDEGWFSVKALGPVNVVGRRANAIFKETGTWDCPVDFDVTLIRASSPEPGALSNCQDISMTNLTVDIKNSGRYPVMNVPVLYRLNGGLPVMEVYPDTIAAGDTVTFSFSNSMDISAGGIYSVHTWTRLSNDMNIYNDDFYLELQVWDGQTVNIPWKEDFESFSNCGTGSNCENTVCLLGNFIVNEGNTITDDIDWRTISGRTPSGSTGPFSDHTYGTSTGKFIYLEASGECDRQAAHMVLPCMDLSSATSPVLTFWYHMWGADMGELHVDLLIGKDWTPDIMNPIIGNRVNSWRFVKIDLTPYKDELVNIRFRGITGNGFRGDMAIDDIHVFDATTSPYVDFSADRFTVCEQATVSFSDKSTNEPASWKWTFNPTTVVYVNGTSDSSQNPQVQFTTLGDYEVMLTASNIHGTADLVKTDFIHVVKGNTLPYLEDFESGTLPELGWRVIDPGGSRTWELQPGITSASDVLTTTARIRNYNYNYPGAEDMLISGIIDLMDIDSAMLYFYMAYAPAESRNSDAFRIDISTDCGHTFEPTDFFKSDSLLVTSHDTVNGWAPSKATDWRKESLDLSPYTGNEIVLGFVNINNFGNHLYLDSIYIEKKKPVGQPAFSLSSIATLDVYPNPTDGLFNVLIQNCSSAAAIVRVYDMQGKLVISEDISLKNRQTFHQIDLTGHARGLYALQLLSEAFDYHVKLILF